jgi:hypothetical protein
MTKKHFEALAKALAELYSKAENVDQRLAIDKAEIAVRNVCGNFCKNFDRDKFRERFWFLVEYFEAE